jgi:O-succinylbenzoate synthase
MNPDHENVTVTSRPYRRPFSRPLKAAWGKWSVREGTLLRMDDAVSGKVGFGECAPLPTSQEPSSVYPDDVPPDPAAEFAEWSGRISLGDPSVDPTPVRSAALLSLNDDTSHMLAKARENGFRTFKLKVGLASTEREWKDLQHLVTSMQSGEILRLDPNRSWDKREWQFWKPRLNGIREWIQFIEEPFSRHFPPHGWLREANTAPVPLALDESLTGKGLAYWLTHRWPGFWVLKPSLLGNPETWLSPVSQYMGKVVLSSAFESGIGLSAVIRLAQEFPGIDHGFGTQAYFDDGFGVPQDGNELQPLTIDQQKDLWDRLPKA